MATVEQRGGFAEMAVGTSSDIAKRLQFFDLQDLSWIRIKPDPAGYPAAIADTVDLDEYFSGMELQVLGCGSFSITNVRVTAGFKLPRHQHNLDQLVFVVAGELIQGNRVLHEGEGYFTKAGQPYSITAGPDGLTWMEVRSAPLAELETIWVETDPARWVHATV